MAAQFRKQMEEDVEALPQGIIQAQEAEAKRVSREIHDDLGQSLVTLKMFIQAHHAASGRRSEGEETKSFRKIIRYLDAIIEKTRGLAAGLRPAALEVLGLTAALRTLINEFRCQKDLRIRFRCGSLDDLRFQGEMINLYRIVQEALTNIVRHAGATHVYIHIKRVKDHLKVVITDNGCGLQSDNETPNLPVEWRGRQTPANSTSSPKGRPTGLGFSTMKERSRLLGGRFEVTSIPQKGTTILVDIPLQTA